MEPAEGVKYRDAIVSLEKGAAGVLLQVQLVQ